jgi:hypothetical protein
MTTKLKPVTLFGRKMRKGNRFYGPDSYHCGAYRVLRRPSTGKWFGHASEGFNARECATPHAAARALERKIESQWKRLGKLLGKEGKK